MFCDRNSNGEISAGMANFRGKGGSGAFDGFMFAMIAIFEHYGAPKAARQMLPLTTHSSAMPLSNDTKALIFLKRDPKGKTAFAGREAPIVSEPLDENGPFYATALYPTMLNTQGGPKKNVRGQVMDPTDRPIPRLYAAGELGSMWGSIYRDATNNAECIVFGRIAGREAAKEKPWQ